MKMRNPTMCIYTRWFASDNRIADGTGGIQGARLSDIGEHLKDEDRSHWQVMHVVRREDGSLHRAVIRSDGTLGPYKGMDGVRETILPELETLRQVAIFSATAKAGQVLTNAIQEADAITSIIMETYRSGEEVAA